VPGANGPYSMSDAIAIRVCIAPEAFGGLDAEVKIKGGDEGSFHASQQILLPDKYQLIN